VVIVNSIFTRRSIRKYLNKEVDNSIIEQLLKAAMQAPSAGNQRSWEFIVVREKELLNQLGLVSPYSGPVKESNVAIIVLGNLANETVKFPECVQQDLAAATQNILLQAAELDLGTVWLGVAPVEERMEKVRSLFNLPQSIMPFSIVAIGYSDVKNNYIDRYEPNKVHYEKY